MFIHVTTLHFRRFTNFRSRRLEEGDRLVTCLQKVIGAILCAWVGADAKMWHARRRYKWEPEILFDLASITLYHEKVQTSLHQAGVHGREGVKKKIWQ